MAWYARLLVVCGRFVALLLLALSLGSFVTLAAAQSKPTARPAGSSQGARPASAPAKDANAPPGYDEAIDIAFKEFELGNYPEARSRFLEAHKLFPSARTFRAIGMVEYELKNYGDAIDALEKALASKVKALEGTARMATEELLDRAKGYVARIALDINPGVATVIVDGVPVELGMGGVLILQVGDHNLEFRAPGRLVERRQLKINGGEEKKLQIVLPPAVEANGQPKKEARPLYKNPWLWAAVGVVAVGAGVGLGVGLSGTETTTADPVGGSTRVSLSGPK
jgi:tetratricopeptide (TPR) repeat protein